MTDRKAYMREFSRRRHERRTHWLSKYKVGKGCAVCGFNGHFAALHFDHVDPSTKKFEVWQRKTGSLKVLMKEVRKCQVLCANCHAEKTWKNK